VLEGRPAIEGGGLKCVFKSIIMDARFSGGLFVLLVDLAAAARLYICTSEMM